MKAYFLDGHSAKRRECEVTFHQNHLLITYENDAGEKQTSEWDPHEILKLDMLTSSKTVKHGEFPHEILEFQTQEDFDMFMAEYPKAQYHRSNYNKFQKFGWKGIVIVLVAVSGVCIAFFLVLAPLIAETFARNIPQEYEEYFGNNIADLVLEYATIDEEKSADLQQFFNELNYATDYHPRLVVVDRNIVNAFAMPGGTIVLYSGILNEIENKEELAGLLAHELSHVNSRHSLRMMSRDLAMYLVFMSITGDVGGFFSVIVENSQLFTTLSNSRDFEKEADLQGMQLMINSEINPRGMVTLFEKFEIIQDSLNSEFQKIVSSDSLQTNSDSEIEEEIQEESNWERVYELISTHPVTKKRIEYLNREIEDADIPDSYRTNDLLDYHYQKLKGD